MSRVREILAEARPSGSGLRRLAIALLTCVLGAAIAVDWQGSSSSALLEVGDVAPRTVAAPFTFRYQDLEAFERQRAQAERSVLPVYEHNQDLGPALQQRVRTAYASARQLLDQPEAEESDPQVLRGELETALQRDLGVALLRADVDALLSARFDAQSEAFATELLQAVMERMVVADRTPLREHGSAITVVHVEKDGEDSETVVEPDEVLNLEDARSQIAVSAMRGSLGGSPSGRGAVAVATALLRPNVTHSPSLTKQRQRQAVAAVNMQLVTVKRSTILFRQGDELTGRMVAMYEALQAHQVDQQGPVKVVVLTLFLLLVNVSLFQYGATYLEGFSRRFRDVSTAATLLLLTGVSARFVYWASPAFTDMLGFEAEASSLWFVVPMAASVMLVRLLIGPQWAVLFTVATSVLCGLVFELRALHTVYFIISGIAAASAVEHTRERITVLRAGLFVGLVNASAALVIHFLYLFVVEQELSAAASMRPLWSMAAGFAGGLISAFLVLGLTPLFEALGFVTDYRLMELANLNHPLLRQLMLRAPGSYHHSVIVGSLAEAGAEAIGANALQSKVASYFHDIGKSLNPEYFVENQRGGNRHSQLDPRTSAKIIIAHVTDGGRLAEEHNLPKVILDNIYMHHGTGLLQYFYAHASAQAGEELDDTDFRYPGPKPNSREAGVIMLADKVEAATRTIKEPTEENIRAMISRIVNSVITDDQFSECPLTFEEIHIVTDTFVQVLLGIYHQRIEYPQTRDLSSGSHDDNTEEVLEGALVDQQAVVPGLAEDTPVIAQGRQDEPDLAGVLGYVAPWTASAGDEMPPPTNPYLDAILADDENTDYESIEHLPRGE